MDPGRLAGMVALVTGGASGLGLAIVRRFVREGARVGVLDRSREATAALERELGGAVACTVGDVREMADNERAVAATVAAFGRLDSLVANAGIFDNRLALAEHPKDRLSAAFDELFGVDVKGYLLAVRAALDELRRTRGSVVFTASVAGLYPGHGGVLYVAAKHAVAGMTRQLAHELGPEVRVNAVAPGFIPTGLRGLESLEQGVRSGTREAAAARSPLGVVPETEDYTELYVLLAGRESATLMTGATLLADSGLSLRGPRPRDPTT